MTQDLLSSMRAAIHQDLIQALAPLQAAQYPELGEMLLYHLGLEEPAKPHGKRVRPMFTLLCCAAAGGDWYAALPASSAVELIHNFSLVHDDIQDRSDYRRGRLTIWKRWGIAQGINAGDAIFALSRMSAARLVKSGVTPEVSLDVAGTLDLACLHLTQGQFLDLKFETQDKITRDQYMRMVEGKTGALFSAACAAGALVGGANTEQMQAYQDFGMNLGVAFQIFDDLLGIWGLAEATGKPVGDDLRARKKSLPVVLGLLGSDRFRHEWEKQASDEPDIESMIQALAEAGIQAGTAEIAQSFTSKAMHALQAAQPSEPAATELNNLAQSLLVRNH
jgi:geranylgeranyl diphosphate synthase type I